jgi:hypothetical protein
MSVVVDDSRSDHQAIGIQDPSRRATYPSDLDDTTTADRDVCVEAWYSGTINNLSIPDDEIVWHCSSSVVDRIR